MKSIDKFVKIIYNKVKGKIITTVILPLYVFVFKTTVRAGAVVLLYCTFVANIAIMTIIANKAKKNFFCICTMLNFHKHSSFLQSCPIWRTENKKKGHITAGVITVKPKFCLIPIVLYNIFFVFSIILTHL